MAYIYCDSCGIGFHSNVHTCPECGRVASRTFKASGQARRTAWGRHSRPAPPREEVESEVREAIYGWHSGTVARSDRTAGETAVGEAA